MTRLFRQAELLKHADEWLQKGYVVTVTPEGIRIEPKEVAKDDKLAKVSMK